MKRIFLRLGLAAALCGAAPGAWAQDVAVKDAWVRGTVTGQKATGAFMELTSKDGAALVGGASPVAGVVEVHEMSMEGGVMRMRAVPKLPLPAGKTVQLTPGGYHIMLMDLKQRVKEGETVPLTLKVEGKDGKLSEVQVSAPVRPLAQPARPAAPMHEGMKH
ncbi:MAG: copper chaperone PCu(A)C [Betaproteobacteria bacterium]|nr:copper chaperone PCu(A)C [Betaproteobacteria bacterium]